MNNTHILYNKHEDIKYKRVIIKYSGEILSNKVDKKIDYLAIMEIAKNISKLINIGVEVGIVIGGGNIFRGKDLRAIGINKVTSDYIGILSTVINSLAVKDIFDSIKLPSYIMSNISIDSIVHAYQYDMAKKYLKHGCVVIFTAGTGNPLFTTDSSACLKAIELHADLIIKATKVNGVYSEDPIKNDHAIHYKYITYDQMLNKKLNIIDEVAICLCKNYNLPIQIFDFKIKHALEKIIFGENIGTLISE